MSLTLYLTTRTSLSSTMQNARQGWDAAHIARARLAERKWVAPSYLSKNTTKSTLSLSTLTFLSSTPSKRDAPSYLSKNNTKSTLFCQPRFFRRRRCEMCSRSGTRRTSRRDAWPTLSGTIGAVSGTSRPTHQKTIQSQRFSPQH